MILRMFAIRDVKALAFMVPFFMPQEGMAIRAFQDMVNDKEHMCSRHPEDFALVLLGEFDDNNGAVVPLDAPKVISQAHQLVRKEVSRGDRA